jgi:hypothetical protein
MAPPRQEMASCGIGCQALTRLCTLPAKAEALVGKVWERRLHNNIMELAARHPSRILDSLQPPPPLSSPRGWVAQSEPVTRMRVLT